MLLVLNSQFGRLFGVDIFGKFLLTFLISYTAHPRWELCSLLAVNMVFARFQWHKRIPMLDTMPHINDVLLHITINWSLCFSDFFAILYLWFAQLNIVPRRHFLREQLVVSTCGRGTLTDDEVLSFLSGPPKSVYLSVLLSQVLLQRSTYMWPSCQMSLRMRERRWWTSRWLVGRRLGLGPARSARERLRHTVWWLYRSEGWWASLRKFLAIVQGGARNSSWSLSFSFLRSSALGYALFLLICTVVGYHTWPQDDGNAKVISGNFFRVCVCLWCHSLSSSFLTFFLVLLLFCLTVLQQLGKRKFKSHLVSLLRRWTSDPFPTVLEVLSFLIPTFRSSFCGSLWVFIQSDGSAIQIDYVMILRLNFWVNFQTMLPLTRWEVWTLLTRSLTNELFWVCSSIG